MFLCFVNNRQLEGFVGSVFQKLHAVNVKHRYHNTPSLKIIRLVILGQVRQVVASAIRAKIHALRDHLRRVGMLSPLGSVDPRVGLTFRQAELAAAVLLVRFV